MRTAKSCSAYQSKKIEIGHVSGNLVKRWPPYSILRSSQPRGTKGSRAASGDIFMAEIQVIWKLSFASFSQIWWLLGYCKARAIFLLRIVLHKKKRVRHWIRYQKNQIKVFLFMFAGGPFMSRELLLGRAHTGPTLLINSHKCKKC